jgi:hypothetical protein
MTEAEMVAKVGPENLKGPIQWRNHDAIDSGAYNTFGATSRARRLS